MEIVVVIGLVLVVLVLVANRKGSDVIVTPTSVDLTLNPATTATVSAHLMYTPFPRWVRDAKRSQGNITVVNAGSLVLVTPASAGTSHTAAAVFTVSPALEGRGTLVFDGTSRHGSHDSALVTYTVT
ncbi:MAG: hypothetical protein O2971_04155 [Proteobacteria bacterium]|nr:hypothetical protein [Pseudomonadota bacterium]